MSNDTSHIYTILLFFISLSLILGYVTTYFNQESIEHNLNISTTTSDPLGEMLDGDNLEVSTLSDSFSKIKLIFKIFFWSFGDIVWWLELVLIQPFRLLSYVLIYRLIRSGGG